MFVSDFGSVFAGCLWVILVLVYPMSAGEIGSGMPGVSGWHWW